MKKKKKGNIQLIYFVIYFLKIYFELEDKVRRILSYNPIT